MSTTNPTQETTEWDDLQRKFGNLPPLKKEIKEEEIYLKQLDKVENIDILENKNLNELKILEEECHDEEYLKIIEKHKNDRLNEINMNRLLNIYGEVYEISKDTFLVEINEASKKNPLEKLEQVSVHNDYVKKENGKDITNKLDSTYNNNNNDNDNNNFRNKKKQTRGTYVVIHMYSDNVIACKVLNKILNEIAIKHKYIKFTKGIYNKVIENYPETRLPTILIYYNGVCIHQITNVLNYIKGGINNLNVKSFEKLLNKYNILKINNHKNESGKRHSSSDNTDNEHSDNNENNYSKNKKNNIKSKKQYTSFNMFQRKYNNSEEDSEENNGEDSDTSSRENLIRSRGYASSYLDNKINLQR
ncbi:phosducin-like protein, putative [Hepatocystis sp. ex Piliocolobus tephrosceles]|nr:phosducin-like protein, putative [Hepatocystis sp. ex Piliocolobus tephrosceles]